MHGHGHINACNVRTSNGISSDSKIGTRDYFIASFDLNYVPAVIVSAALVSVVSPIESRTLDPISLASSMESYSTPNSRICPDSTDTPVRFS